MPFTLPALPYPVDALETAIDKMTMEIHHGRHHKAYVDNLNKALEGQAALDKKPIIQLLREISQVPDKIRTDVVWYRHVAYHGTRLHIMRFNQSGNRAGCR